MTLTPEIAPSLKQQISSSETDKNIQNTNNADSKIVEIGTMCKNGACNVAYSGSETDNTVCIYHPGVPIFHEGLKYWSCCKKRTTEFNDFLAQIGCSQGKHVWIKEVRLNELLWKNLTKF